MTGGAGFIGSHLSELLLDDGWEVWALDDLSTGALDNVEHLRERREFHLVVDSVLSRAVVSELVHKCDVVYHLAAAVGVRLIVEQPVHTIVTNLAGHRDRARLLQPLRQARAVASSSEVYGDHRDEKPLDEDDAARLRADDRAPLGVRRLEGDGRVPRARLPPGAWPRLRHRPALQHRRPPADGPVRDGRAAVRGACTRRRPLEVFGDGMQTRCFCHVSDTIRALHGLMEAPAPRARSSTSARASRSSIVDLAQKVIDTTGSTSAIVVRPVRGGIRPRDRGHAPPHPVDREDPRGDRLATDARPRPRSSRTSSPTCAQRPEPTEDRRPPRDGSPRAVDLGQRLGRDGRSRALLGFV